MKTKFLLFLLFVVSISCQKKVEQTQNYPASQAATIKKIIDGKWYETAYIADVQKTKSPFASRTALATIVELDIDVSQTVGDTLKVGAPSIHEGASFKIVFRPGLAPNSVRTDIIDPKAKLNFAELGYNISDKDTTLIMYRYNQNKKLISKKSYKKAPKNAESAVQYMVNKTLFAGNYKMEENYTEQPKITFSSNGVVTGLPNFKTYYLVTDFVAEPDIRFDTVCFDIQTSNQECFRYKISGDTLRLYGKTDDSRLNLRPDVVKHTLIRQ